MVLKPHSRVKETKSRTPPKKNNKTLNLWSAHQMGSNPRALASMMHCIVIQQKRTKQITRNTQTKFDFYLSYKFSLLALLELEHAEVAVSSIL